MPRGRAVRDSQKTKFLEALRECGIVSQAAKAAKMGVQTVTDHRAKDEAFAAAMDEAIDLFLDHAEHVVWNRALHGWDEPVYQNGMLIGEKRKYSDTLAIFMLKGHRPQKYRDNMSIEHQVSTADVLEEEIKQAMSRAGKAVDEE